MRAKRDVIKDRERGRKQVIDREMCGQGFCVQEKRSSCQKKEVGRELREMEGYLADIEAGISRHRWGKKHR